MFKYFKGSFIVTVLGIMAAYLWGEHVKPGSGMLCVFIASFLAILEISLSFDNAVVNAMKLEKMSEKWRHRFITWGIIIAVFGMRFLFPLMIVAIFSKLNILSVLNMALHDVNTYTKYLTSAHAPIVTFGGAFLMILFLNYFTTKKDVHWLEPIEKFMEKLPYNKLFCTIFVFIIVSIVAKLIKPEMAINTFISGSVGIISYLCIDGLANWLENKQEKRIQAGVGVAKCSGLIGFLYLELIDASFSLDGVLGSFAISSDIIIITIGLFIGAMFVRSLTIMLVEKNTLKEFKFLEHGAHWAIGILAILMFVSVFKEIPEVITGLSGFILILSSFISSLIENKRNSDV